MSFLGNLLGKKKEEEPDFRPATGLGQQKESFDDLDSGLNLPGVQEQSENFDSFGNPRSQKFSSPFEQEQQRSTGFAQQKDYSQQQSPGDLSKDMQIVLAKLDAIKSEIANISHRLESLEKQHGQQQKKFW